MREQLEQKWVIGIEHRLGPCRTYALPIRTFFDEETYWYLPTERQLVVSQSRVFDTAQEAALGAIKANDCRTLPRSWFSGR